jgi:hypothetical protein
MLVRIGVQRGFGEYARLKRMPLAARESICGVLRYFEPMTQLMVSANCWSVIITRTLGLDADFAGTAFELAYPGIATEAAAAILNLRKSRRLRYSSFL